MDAQEWARFSPFLVILPIAIIFFVFAVILIYRSFFSDKSWNKSRLMIGGISSVVGIGTLIISMISISKAIHVWNAARDASPNTEVIFTWSFLPYIIVMAVSAVVLILAILTSQRTKTA
jgi:NADH:ubiquinone oxidoreductase subunit 6 (subunit J)